jgi:hypothetical protein
MSYVPAGDDGRGVPVVFWRWLTPQSDVNQRNFR